MGIYHSYNLNLFHKLLSLFNLFPIKNIIKAQSYRCTDTRKTRQIQFKSKIFLKIKFKFKFLTNSVTCSEVKMHLFCEQKFPCKFNWVLHLVRFDLFSLGKLQSILKIQELHLFKDFIKLIWKRTGFDCFVLCKKIWTSSYISVPIVFSIKIVHVTWMWYRFM